MPRFSINIVTVERSSAGKPDYLPGTIRSLARSGLFDRTDFRLTLWDSGSPHLRHIEAALAEVPVGAPSAPVRVQESDHRIGVHENFHRALVGAVDDDDPEFVLLLEDDLVVVHDWLGCVDLWLGRFFRSPYRLATFYAAYDWVERIWVATGGRLGAWRYPVASFYGTQCFAMRPDVALGVAETAIRPGLDGYPDIRLKSYFEPDEHFLASVPCFVQHVGRESSLNTMKHTTSGFLGEDWTMPDGERRPPG